MTKHIKLLPCPFCGKEARFGLEGTTLTATGGSWYYVMCSRCLSVNTATRKSPAAAARLWNKRAHPTVGASHET